LVVEIEEGMEEGILIIGIGHSLQESPHQIKEEKTDFWIKYLVNG